MTWKYILPFLIGVCFCFKAAAISTPASARFIFSDTLISTSHLAKAPITAKKASFFGKLKNKVLGIAMKNYIAKEGNGDKKKTLGLVSIGLIALGFGLLALGAGGLIFLVLLLGGLTTGIVALSIKDDKGEPKTNKKKKTAALIGVILGGGLLLALIISLASWRPH